MFTGDKSGIIMKTMISSEDKIITKEIVDKTSGIVALGTNQEGTILAYATYNLKIYIFNIDHNFSFEKLGKLYYEVSYLFFSKSDYLLLSCGENGNVIGWKL